MRSEQAESRWGRSGAGRRRAAFAVLALTASLVASSCTTSGSGSERTATPNAGLTQTAQAVAWTATAQAAVYTATAQSEAWTATAQAAGSPVGTTSATTTNTRTQTATSSRTATASPTATVVGAFRAYVTNNGSGTVSVIAGPANAVVATIPVGTAPSYVDVSPNGSFVYVVSIGSPGTVSVISAAALSVVATVTTGVPIREVLFHPNGSFAYLAGPASSVCGCDVVSVLNTATHSVVTTIGLVVQGSASGDLAMMPNGSRLFVAAGGYFNLGVIDTASNTVLASLTTADLAGSADMVVTPNGSYLFVAKSGGVTALLTATNAVVATISTGGGDRLAVTPNGSIVYAASGGGSGAVSAISVASLSVIATITISNPVFADVSPSGSHLWVTGSAGLYAVDTATHWVSGFVGISASAYGCAVSPNGSFVFTTNLGSNTVSVVDATTYGILATIPVGGSPTKIAFGP